MDAKEVYDRITNERAWIERRLRENADKHRQAERVMQRTELDQKLGDARYRTLRERLEACLDLEKLTRRKERRLKRNERLLSRIEKMFAKGTPMSSRKLDWIGRKCTRIYDESHLISRPKGMPRMMRPEVALLVRLVIMAVLTLAFVELVGLPYVKVGESSGYFSVTGTKNIGHGGPVVVVVPLDRSVFAYGLDAVTGAWTKETGR